MSDGVQMGSEREVVGKAWRKWNAVERVTDCETAGRAGRREIEAVGRAELGFRLYLNFLTIERDNESLKHYSKRVIYLIYSSNEAV